MMNANISQYESVCLLSSRMVAAARANDWDNLCELEHEAATLIEQVKMSDPAAQHEILGDETLRQRKIALIHQILANDREIRSHAQPWLESVRVMLAASSRQRAVKNLYGINNTSF